MKKVTVQLKVALDIEVDDLDKVAEVLSEMDYGFKAADGASGKIVGSEIVESEIVDWENKEQ